MTESAGARDLQTLGAVRRVLSLLLLVALIGTFIELLLLEHDESALQVIPLVLLACGVVALVSTTLHPRVIVVTMFRISMVLLILSGALGLALHYRANLEFQRDLTPSLGSVELFWKVMAAKAPPALAPAVLAQLGGLGLVYAYRLPVRSHRSAIGESDVEVH